MQQPITIPPPSPPSQPPQLYLCYLMIAQPSTTYLNYSLLLCILILLILTSIQINSYYRRHTLLKIPRISLIFIMIFVWAIFTIAQVIFALYMYYYIKEIQGQYEGNEELKVEISEKSILLMLITFSQIYVLGFGVNLSQYNWHFGVEAIMESYTGKGTDDGYNKLDDKQKKINISKMDRKLRKMLYIYLILRVIIYIIWVATLLTAYIINTQQLKKYLPPISFNLAILDSLSLIIVFTLSILAIQKNKQLHLNIQQQQLKKIKIFFIFMIIQGIIRVFVYCVKFYDIIPGLQSTFMVKECKVKDTVDWMYFGVRFVQKYIMSLPAVCFVLALYWIQGGRNEGKGKRDGDEESLRTQDEVIYS